MKIWKKLRGYGLSWLMILVMMLAGMTGLSGCTADGSVDAELVGQVASVAVDIAMEELLEEDGAELALEESVTSEESRKSEDVHEAVEPEKSEEVQKSDPGSEVDTTGGKNVGIDVVEEKRENTPSKTQSEESTEADDWSADIEEDGWYTDKERVALYIHLYGRLPGNFIDKNDAEKLGWESSKGNLDDVAPGMSIGGNRFGNREGLLPKKKGRTYYECDINYEGGYRGGERIVFSDDGLIYYTEDHYESFELLYTEEGPAQ